VSAFIADANSHRNRETYINLGKELLQIPICKVIFIEPENVVFLGEDYNKKFNKIVPFSKDELMFSDIGEVALPSVINSTKDTKQYMVVINNKTNWVKLAIEMNPFQTDQFVWVDFGMAHLFHNNSEKYKKAFEKIPQRTYNKVRIASIWDPTKTVRKNIFHQPLWYFAGGVFGGDRKSLLSFHAVFVQTIRAHLAQGRLTWEVNFWYQVYKQVPTLFDPYCGSHDPSCLEAY